jgi:hypothetical protein
MAQDCLRADPLRGSDTAHWTARAVVCLETSIPLYPSSAAYSTSRLFIVLCV